MDKAFLSTFLVSLFALINPLGMLPVFIGYTSRENRAVQGWVAVLVSLTVLGLLLLFLFSGTALLDFFGISLSSFRIAGGILLLLIGIHLVLGDTAAGHVDLEVASGLSDWQEAQSVYRRIVIPMAMPLLVGPGVIANVILYANEASTKAGTAGLLEIAAACAVDSVLVCATLWSGRWLHRVLGDVGLSIATRILGLLVAAIGVQFMIVGITHVVVHTIAPQLRG